MTSIKRLPGHIGIIPDGNRRWAERQGMPKEAGYSRGLAPGLQVYRLCRELGVEELTFYGFTRDNTKRPTPQKHAFRQACVDAVTMLAEENATLLVMGDHESEQFPPELIPYRTRTQFGTGGMKVNFLVNYAWQWDLTAKVGENGRERHGIPVLASSEISRIDLIIRWGGRCRLSGFLPVQSVYADVYVVEALWPDFLPGHLLQALQWYEHQDLTYGG